MPVQAREVILPHKDLPSPRHGHIVQPAGERAAGDGSIPWAWQRGAAMAWGRHPCRDSRNSHSHRTEPRNLPGSHGLTPSSPVPAPHETLRLPRDTVRALGSTGNAPPHPTRQQDLSRPLSPTPGVVLAFVSAGFLSVFPCSHKTRGRRVSYGLLEVFAFPGADVEPLRRGDRERDAPGGLAQSLGTADSLCADGSRFQLRAGTTSQSFLPAAPDHGERTGRVEDGWAAASALGGHITEVKGVFSGQPWQDKGFPGAGLLGWVLRLLVSGSRQVLHTQPRALGQTLRQP